MMMKSVVICDEDVYRILFKNNICHFPLFSPLVPFLVFLVFFKERENEERKKDLLLQREKRISEFSPFFSLSEEEE